MEEPPPPLQETDRERALREKGNKKVDPAELRKKLVAAPTPKYAQIAKKRQEDRNNQEVLRNASQNFLSGIEKTSKPVRDYVCDKCKICDEFFSKKSKGTKCDGCGCDLIYHLRDGDESEEDLDPQEWNDDDEDDED